MIQRNKKIPKDNEAQKLSFHKVRTNIPGFDELLYGGLDISSPCTVIFIKGEEDAERALFGLQLLYGLAQSIKDILPEADFKKYYPNFISTVQDPAYINDVLLDIIISSSITQLRNQKLSSNIKYSSTFSSVFFKLDKILCEDFEPSLYDYLPFNIIEDIDELICMEAAYYSNRTNSLHFRTKDATSDTSNILFGRKWHEIINYFVFEPSKEKKPHPSLLKIMNDLSEYVGFNYIPMYISHERDMATIKQKIFKTNIISIDIPDVDENKAQNLIEAILETKNECKKIAKKIEESLAQEEIENRKPNESVPHHVIVVTLPFGVERLIPDYLADMIISLKPTEIQNYRIDQLSIDKSKLQTSSLGWHQYKYRDYGFEVYPSLHRIFQVRRYLQRAMVYTHSNVISDTYQQYLFQTNSDNCNNSLQDYLNSKCKITEAYLEALYPEQRLDYRTSELLSRIILHNPEREPQKGDTEAMIQNHIHKTQEGVTAIIGNGNTFKRFLTFGGIFSSSINKEHTLILMLNKDERMIRRRLGCPARINRDRSDKRCGNCYSFIHFMNIMMGCITPEEFIYYLQLQLDTPFQDGKTIKRIIIDDLQILDYCFPLLKNNSLFISALAMLCRERDITLHILCDKNGESVQALRAIADNIICTDRDESGKLLVYVERFAGYHNSPSKIYCGKVCSVSQLFECYDRRNTCFQINNGAIEEIMIPSMDWFWFNRKDSKTQR